MDDAIPKRALTFGQAARYRIAVQGHISADTIGRLGGLEALGVDTPAAPGRTVLVGRLRDQAELSGVLNTLYDLHFPILEVQVLEGDETIMDTPSG